MARASPAGTTDYVAALKAAKSPVELRATVIRYMDSRNIAMFSYHHYPPLGAPDFRSQLTIVSRGFPAEWVDRYQRERLYEIDPIIRVAMTATEPFWWSEIRQLTALSSRERRYMQMAAKADLGDGMAVPVFGPSGRNGYFGIGFHRSLPRPDDAACAEVHWICQVAHLKYCALISARLPEPAQLSAREKEILSLVIRGRSNQEIAEELSLSANTVDTYVRRSFGKLDVNDRISAGLRGLALGLIY